MRGDAVLLRERLRSARAAPAYRPAPIAVVVAGCARRGSRLDGAPTTIETSRRRAAAGRAQRCRRDAGSVLRREEEDVRIARVERRQDRIDSVTPSPHARISPLAELDERRERALGSVGRSDPSTRPRDPRYRREVVHEDAIDPREPEALEAVLDGAHDAIRRVVVAEGRNGDGCFTVHAPAERRGKTRPTFVERAKRRAAAARGSDRTSRSLRPKP